MDWYRALLCCSAVCHLGLMPSGTVGSESSTNPMWTEPFEGVDRIQLVGCRKTVENGFQLMQLKDYNSSLLVSWVKEGSKCEAPGPYFAACVVDEAVSVVTLKVVVTDLQDGETRNFFCRPGYIHAEGLMYRDSNISVTYTVPTSVTSLAPTTTENWIRDSQSL